MPGVSDNYQIVKTKQKDSYTLSVEVEPSEVRFKEGHLDEFEKKAENRWNPGSPAMMRPPCGDGHGSFFTTPGSAMSNAHSRAGSVSAT